MALHKRAEIGKTADPALACEAGVSIKPGVERGFASGTPAKYETRFEPAEQAAALRIIAVARFTGSRLLLNGSWGCARKASLHPRLYADACFAGTNLPNQGV